MARAAELAGVAAVALLGAAAAAGPLSRRRAAPLRRVSSRPPQRAAQTVSRAAALLALAALADSGIEHYRGSFQNRTMYVPLGVAGATLAASLRDGLAAPEAGSELGAAVDNLALATGIIGTGFHFYNVVKRPGGFGWQNLFYAAPLGAPASLSLAGLLRKSAERLRRGEAGFRRWSPARLLAALVAAGIVGTTAEAGLLHFRGAYHNPFMFVPVTVPPVAAALLARAALTEQRPQPAARWALRLLAAIGLAGSGFHAFGVGRNMGGWRNWSQNLLNGPPLPAPPAYTALAIAGLAALGLIEEGQA